jgi:hypothetical protein
MKSAFRITLIAAAALGASMLSQAATINGSLPLSGQTVTENGATLATSTLIQSVNTVTSGVGTGDYIPVPLGASFGPTSLNLSNFLTFALSNATFGAFSTSSGVVVSQTASFLDVFLTGTFTPGSGLAAGLTPTVSSVRISVNQSGASLSEAITLNSPALSSPVPEPGTSMFLAAGLIGVLGYGWRRQRG